MADNLLRVIIEAIDQASGTFAKVGAEAEGMGASLTASSGALLATGAAVAGVGVAIGGALIAATDQAAGFQTMLTQVQNNTTLTTAQTQAMGAAIEQMSAESGASLESLSQGFMRAVNITGSATDATEILRAAMESAVSTGGDVAATTNILANVMHEFGLSADQAAQTMGVLHLAAAEGNLTLEQFVESSGKAMSIAANLGVPLNDVGAAFAALTKHGFDAAQAQTQIVDMFTHMINPTKAVRGELERLSQATGVDLVHDFSAAGLSSKGLTGVLADLKTAYERMGLSSADAEQESLKLINAQRGGIGLAALLGTAYGDYTTVLGDLTDQQRVATVTQDAYTRSLDTAQQQGAIAKARLRELAIAVGDDLLPALTGFLQAINPVLDGLTHWATQNADLVATLGVVATVVLTGVGGLMLLRGAVGLVGGALDTLGGSLRAVIGLFGQKEAAKASLTAANKTLATSVGETSAAMDVAGTTAFASAADFAAFTGAAVAAAGANVALMGAIQRHVTSQQDQARAIQETTTAQDAMTFAVQHGFDAIHSSLPTFSAWLQAQGRMPATTNEMAGAWNAYIDDLARSGAPVGGLTRATFDLDAASQSAANGARDLGVRLGAVVAPAQAASDAIAVAANGARDLGVRFGPAATGIATGANAIGSTTAAAGNALSGMYDAVEQVGGALRDGIGQVGSWAAAVDRATAVVKGDNDALNALQSQKGQFQAYLQTLQTEWDGLTAAVAKQGYATDAQKARMAELAPEITYVHQKIADLGTATDSATDAAVKHSQALDATTAKAAAAQAAQASLAGGLSATRDAMLAAQDSAHQLGDGIRSVPTTLTTTVTTPGMQDARDQIGFLQGDIANTPKDFTVTAHVDLSEAEFAIGKLSREMPHSPAQEGPLSVLPNWNALFDGIKAAGDTAVKDLAATLSAMAQAITGFTSAAAGLATFVAPGAGQVAGFVGFVKPLVQSIVEAAAAFSTDGLAAAKTFAESGSAVATLLKDGVAGLAALATFVAPPAQAVAAFKFAVEDMVRAIGDSAATFSAGFLAQTGLFADAAGKALGTLKGGVDGLTALATFMAPPQSAVAAFVGAVQGFLANLAAAAQAFQSDALTQTTAFAGAVGAALQPVANGVTALTALNTFVAPSRQAIDNFLAAMQYVVNRFGQMAASLSDDGIKKTTAFSNAAGAALGATKTGVDAFIAMAKLTVPSKQAIDDLLGGIKYVVQRAGDIADAIGAQGLAKAQQFATGAGAVFAALKGAIDLLSSLGKLKDDPGHAFDALLGGIQAALGKLAAMQAQANTFLSNARTFADTMQQAANTIARGIALGQGSPVAGAPGRATGGPVLAGQAYTVGEGGAETFVPATNGFILPSGLGGGGQTVYNVTVNVAGNVAAEQQLSQAVYQTLLRLQRSNTTLGFR